MLNFLYLILHYLIRVFIVKHMYRVKAIRVFLVKNTYQSKIIQVFLVKHTYQSKIIQVFLVKHTYQSKIIQVFLVKNTYQSKIIRVFLVQYLYPTKKQRCALANPREEGLETSSSRRVSISTGRVLLVHNPRNTERNAEIYSQQTLVKRD